MSEKYDHFLTYVHLIYIYKIIPWRIMMSTCRLVTLFLKNVRRVFGQPQNPRTVHFLLISYVYFYFSVSLLRPDDRNKVHQRFRPDFEGVPWDVVRHVNAVEDGTRRIEETLENHETHLLTTTARYECTVSRC